MCYCKHFKTIVIASCVFTMIFLAAGTAVGQDEATVADKLAEALNFYAELE